MRGRSPCCVEVLEREPGLNERKSRNQLQQPNTWGTHCLRVQEQSLAAIEALLRSVEDPEPPEPNKPAAVSVAVATAVASAKLIPIEEIQLPEPKPHIQSADSRKMPGLDVTVRFARQFFDCRVTTDSGSEEVQTSKFMKCNPREHSGRRYGTSDGLPSMFEEFKMFRITFVHCTEALKPSSN